MKLILGLVLLSLVWNCVSTASVARTANQCVSEYYGNFSVGRTALTKECGVAICKEDGKLTLDICPAILVAPGYIIVPEDLSKPHPECCETAVKAPEHI